MRPLPLVATLALAACGSLSYYEPTTDVGPAETGQPATTGIVGDDDDDDTTGPPVEDCLAPGDEDADGDADCADPDCATTCDADEDGVITRDLGGEDCDDGDPDVRPGVFDDCDGEDDDCNDVADDGDADRDGATVCADCDDGDAGRHPGAPDVCDGFDADCDALDCSGFSDGFESGALGNDWVVDGTRGFVISQADAHSGTWSAKSGAISDYQTSTLELALDFSADGTISFWHTGETEACCDDLKFLVDGVVVDTWSGTWAWRQATFPVSAGSHRFVWRYRKDESRSNGSDRVFVDDVVATNGFP